MKQFLRSLLVVAALLGASLACAASYSIGTVIASPDGLLHTSNPAGDYTSPATLACDTNTLAATTPLTTDTNYSSSATSGFTGSGAGSVTVTLQTVSGDAYTVGGFSISSGNLVATGSAGYAGHSGVARLLGNGSVQCPSWSWAWVAPVVTDTQAPAIPTGLTSTAQGTGTVTLQWLASRDPYNSGASTPGSGVSTYNIKLNGSALTTQAGSVGLTAQNILAKIGSITTGTCNQSGADWTMTADGVGISQGTADGKATCGTTFTGDGHVSAKVTGCTASTSFYKCGVGVSADNSTAGAITYNLYTQGTLSSGGTLVQYRARTTTGGSAGTIAQTTAACANPDLSIMQTSGVLTAQYSCGGGAWTTIDATQTVSWSSAYWYIGATSTDPAVTATVAASFSNVNINNNTTVSKVVTTSCTTAPCVYTVNAQDALGNVSADSTSVSALAVAPSGTGVKWNPGVYVWTAGTQNCNSAPAVGSAEQSLLATIASDTTIKGIEVVGWWDCFEGNTQGDYSAGFALLDAYIAILKAQASPKHLIIKLENEEYAGSGCTGTTDHAPNYLATAGLIAYCTSTSRWSAMLWTAAGMDRMIALSAAYAARYDNSLTTGCGAGQALGCGAYFEMITPFEQSALAVVGNGYSNSAWDTQMRRYAAAARTHWAHTLVRMPHNYLGADSFMRASIEAIKAPGIAFGGPDTLPDANRPITSNYMWRGCASGGACTPGTTYSDLRGTYAWVAEVESPELGGSYCTSCTLSSIQSYASTTMHNNYIIWYYNTWVGTSATQWAAQLAFIRAGSSVPYSLTCPSSETCQ